MSAFGGKGYFVNTPEELQNAVKASLADKRAPSLINVMIDPQSERKKQVFMSSIFCELHVGIHLKYLGSITKATENVEVIARQKDSLQIWEIYTVVFFPCFFFFFSFTGSYQNSVSLLLPEVAVVPFPS